MPPGSAPTSVLVRLLQAAGYRLEARSEATVAVRSRDRRAVVIARSGRSPADLEALFPSDAVHRTLVYDDEPGGGVRAAAAERGIEIVEPSTLGAALGELLLPSSADADPAAGDANEELARPFPIVPDGGQIVRPRIGRAEAESLAGIDGSRYTLRLVPYFVAGYRVRPRTLEGRPGAVVDRLVAVNATTRRPEVWDGSDRELVPSLDDPHQRLAPQMSAEQARPIAVEAIRRRHSVRVDHTEQHGGALVIETRRVAPSSDDIRLGPLALVYVPHWYAEGTEGRIVLDAVTGARVGGGEPSVEL